MIPGFENIPGLTLRAFKQYNNFILLVENLHYIDNPIVSKRLEAALDISGPEIRSLRAMAWRKGDEVISGGGGYFWAKTSVEVKSCKDSITARKNALITAENDLDKMIFRFLDNEKYRLFV